MSIERFRQEGERQTQYEAEGDTYARISLWPGADLAGAARRCEDACVVGEQLPNGLQVSLGLDERGVRR